MSRRPLGVLRRALPVVLLGVALVGARPAQAQDTYEVRGVVADSAGVVQERAMVVALALPDSVLTTFSTTDADGAFTLRRVPPGDYLLQVQLASFQTLRTPFTVVDADVELGTATVAALVYGLEPLVVSVDHVPFQNRRDTLVFNAAAFEVRPNATVEDLLRRLPGFEIDADGTIEVQGEVIQQVLVEGREFFGGDATIATRGLPADAVERVEVFDKESDMAEFTGIPDGNERKTLNLDLTEEAQTGYFGQVSGSLGASETAPTALSQAGDGVRYEEQFGLNRFSPSTQLALTGGLNNVSRARFSVGAVAGGGGRGDVGGGGGGGFTRSGTLGVNASRQFSDDDWIRSSYFFSDLSREQENTRLQQQLLGSSVSSTIRSAGTQVVDNSAHRFNLDGQRRFAPGTQLRVRGALNATSSTVVSTGDRATVGAGGSPLNTELSRSGTESDALSGNAAVTFMQRLGDGGRSLIFNMGANLSSPESTGDQASTIEVFGSNGSSITEILQTQRDDGRTFTNSQRLSITQPLGDGRTLELFGERRDQSEEQSREVFDVSSGTPIPVARLTSGLDQTYGYLAGGLRLNRNTENTRFVVSLQAQKSSLEGTIDGRAETIENDYTRFLPSADLRLQLGESHNVSLRWTTNTREPTMQELQPFADNSSPTNVYVGNPDLVPEYVHAVNADWRYFDAFSFLNVFTYARVSRTSDDIVTSRTIDDRGFQTAMPVNAGNTWSGSAGLNFGRPIRSLGVNVSVDLRSSLTRRPEFVNGDENLARIAGNAVSLQVQNREKDLFDLQVEATLDFNDVAYSLNDELDQSYMNPAVSARGTLYLGQDWTLAGDASWRSWDRDVFGDVPDVSLLNLSISRYVLDQRGSIELAAVDLLNESQVVNIASSPQAITESRTQALGRYLMLRFDWRLGNLGGRGRR